MAETKRIYLTDYIAQWEKDYNKWEDKFSFKEKDKEELPDGKRHEWGHIWQGETCLFGDKELIHGVTIVSGVRNEPEIYQPEEFVKKFDFTQRNPITGKKILPSEKDFYYKAFVKNKETIEKNAKNRTQAKNRQQSGIMMSRPQKEM